ncbi:putative aldehyde dehydrogenase DhaS [Bacillus rossius redtenbacheri]|uniref:putative aldehyde dehydrogenase DhaS n=1 Tax=Bacillus rossius redtenbacheri TaxID=93214 RepID=UPI002FDCFD48
MAVNHSKKIIPEIFESMEYGLLQDSASLAEAWLKDRSFGPLIDWQWKDTAAGGASSTEIHDPCTGRRIATVADSTAEDVAKAVSSSWDGFGSWSQLSGHERARHLYSIARHLQKHTSLLVQLESLNRGVQTSDPREFDVPAAVRCFYHYAGWAELAAHDLAGREPVGVVAGVTSWSSPLSLLAWMVAPALAVGNTVCLAPSRHAPLPAFLLAHICAQAGLPAGVLSVLPGGESVAEQLGAHERVAGLVLAGQTSAGRGMLQAAAATRKRVTCLLSGKSVMMVFDSADIDSAVDSVIGGAWFNQGQVPWAITKLLVQESIFTEFLDKLKVKMEGVKVGTSFNKMANVGQPFTVEVVTEVNRIVAKAREKGLQMIQAKLENDLQSSEWFFTPTVVIGTNVESNKVVEDDVLAPVVSVSSFRTAKEAVAQANNSRYGIAASVWTETAALALEVANQLQVGTVWINSHGLFDAAVPFSGWKQSGIGCFGGKRGLLEFMREKCEPAPGLKVSVDYKSFGTATDPESTVPRDLAPTVQASHSVDRTYKLYYGGAYKRPDGNSSRTVFSADGKPFALVAEGSRKDARNAVEAALKAQPGWWKLGAHSRAQIIFNLAEKLQACKDDFISHLQLVSGCDAQTAAGEVNRSLALLFHWAARCDKPPCTRADPPGGAVASVSQEPLGVVAVISCDRDGAGPGLESFLRGVVPAVACGNAVVAVVGPGGRPTLALEACQLLDSCDMPAGVVGVLTGERDALAATLARHRDVGAVWVWAGDPALESAVRWASAPGIKRVWAIREQAGDEEVQRHATLVKSIWITAGETFAN